jgi:2-methylisocitrate lyase-like PEP mutase family enzyme
MDLRTQNEKADGFRSLHDGSRVLVLPNAWDAASARIFEEAGFEAIGTTSAGIAWSLGRPDGEEIGREEMVEATRRIAHAVSVPVTADIEGGYGRTAEEVAQTVEAIILAGSVGVNLEDGTGDPKEPLRSVLEQVERVLAAREAASSAGVGIVLNARTDVYWLAVGEEDERFSLAVERANAYREAGADCLFVPGVGNPETVGALAREVGGPLNVLAGPGVPPVPELELLGVARLSVGSGPARATLALTRRIAEELLELGTYEALAQDTIPYAEVDGLMSARDG